MNQFSFYCLLILVFSPVTGFAGEGIGATLAEGVRDWRWYLLFGGLAVFISIRALMAIQWVIIALLQGIAVASIFSVIASLFSDNDTVLLAVSSIGIVIGISHIVKLNKKYKP